MGFLSGRAARLHVPRRREHNVGDCSALPREDVQGSRLIKAQGGQKQESVERGVRVFSVLGSRGFCWARRVPGWICV